MGHVVLGFTVQNQLSWSLVFGVDGCRTLERVVSGLPSAQLIRGELMVVEFLYLLLKVRKSKGEWVGILKSFFKDYCLEQF